MAYNELIKNFERTRDYMRAFYVYGFKTRNDYDAKSARTYDDERRRVASWLGPYMGFRQNEKGRQVFLSVDNRDIPHNPLYTAFQAKSFTDLDIFLHFALLDMLREEELSARECMDRLAEDYWLGRPEDIPEDSAVRRKLAEYRELGLLTARKQGKEWLYRVSQSAIPLSRWRDAVDFYAEALPLGVVGSFFEMGDDSLFRFKHRYLLDALDSEIMEGLLTVMAEHRHVKLTIFKQKIKTELTHPVYPLRIFLGTQSGRQYLLCWHEKQRHLLFFRLDGIRRVTVGETEENAAAYEAMVGPFCQHLWGVSIRNRERIEHVEMTVRAEAWEAYIVERLLREKRNGSVSSVDEHTWLFTADVHDALEMLPWVRTFIGRIESFHCSNPYVEKRFREDLNAMAALYEGGAEP